MFTAFSGINFLRICSKSSPGRSNNIEKDFRCKVFPFFRICFIRESSISQCFKATTHNSGRTVAGSHQNLPGPCLPHLAEVPDNACCIFLTHFSLFCILPHSLTFCDFFHAYTASPKGSLFILRKHLPIWYHITVKAGVYHV